MPLYENTVTGKQAVLSEDYVRVFPDGSFKLIEQQTDTEKAEAERIEREEAKVVEEREAAIQAAAEQEKADAKAEAKATRTSTRKAN